MPIDTKISTFQNFDGSNFSTAGVSYNTGVGGGSLGGYAGVGTEFTSGSTGLIFDINGSMPYGNSGISGGFRVRHNLNKNSRSVQIRVQPATVKIPLNNKTELYAVPYDAAKINYSTGKVGNSVGIFSGVSTKIGNASVFVEGQIYDVTSINAGTTGVNAGISIPL